MTPIPFEDGFQDVLGKAQRGFQYTDEQVVDRAGITHEQWKAALAGQIHDEVLEKLSGVLNLNASALTILAHQRRPIRHLIVPGVHVFNSDYGDMTVNAYLVIDPMTKTAVAFDTGADISPMLATLAAENARLEFILLTHTHGDHIMELDRLKEKTGAPAYVGDREPLDGAVSFTAGKWFTAGMLKVETRLTWGHSLGGITYVIHGLCLPVAVVGDAIFASSMGGGKISYPDALTSNREQILTLPPETVLCPGHGPLTTVAEEMTFNPFLA